MGESFDLLLAEVNTAPPTRKLQKLLERTNLPADVKKILFDLADMTIEIGGKVLAVGRRILAFALDLLRTFPTMTVGVIVAYVIASIVASVPVPVLNAALSAILTPLLLILGIGMGALMDMGSPDFRQRVQHLIDSFGALVGA